MSPSTAPPVHVRRDATGLTLEWSILTPLPGGAKALPYRWPLGKPTPDGHVADPRAEAVLRLLEHFAALEEANLDLKKANEELSDRVKELEGTRSQVRQEEERRVKVEGKRVQGKG